MRAALALILLVAAGGDSDRFAEAERLEGQGQYAAALAKYTELLGASAAADDRLYARALYHAAQCEIQLGQLEHALDRVRAARLPKDLAPRAALLVQRLELLRMAQSHYGFSEDAEEGASG